MNTKSDFRASLDEHFAVVGTVMKNPPRDITDDIFGGDTVWVPLDDVAQMVELTPRPKP